MEDQCKRTGTALQMTLLRIKAPTGTRRRRHPRVSPLPPPCRLSYFYIRHFAVNSRHPFSASSFAFFPYLFFTFFFPPFLHTHAHHSYYHYYHARIRAPSIIIRTYYCVLQGRHENTRLYVGGYTILLCTSSIRFLLMRKHLHYAAVRIPGIDVPRCEYTYASNDNGIGDNYCNKN